ncbi:SGNH hydrolase-type esterase domain-containing protein [Podospora appendiculata]|uniref:SGNH hydrolase-type esterase domain-containing protein n=1 Tax=Podospora appendiculata TaxID=314037 RepID=A0AAE0X8S7_9PEZI|nr:SGNH hydrolase-type esterase domain-containing protein [Podospora appendiculata]
MVSWFVLLVAALAAPSLAANITTPLRIMPLGASVTFGVGSTTGDSYRKDLRDLLIQAGYQVSLVGQQKHGNFADNAVEATPGFVISQITASAHIAAPRFLPNLVLVDAGTNNCNKGGLVPDAGTNVSAMIDDIFKLSPGATVMLTTLLANKVAEQDACRVDVNKQYAALAADFATKNAKFVLVDMRGPDAPTTSDLFDTRHPNDRGYEKMAAVWFQGIQTARSRGLISAPARDVIPLNATGKSGPGGSAFATHMSGADGPLSSSLRVLGAVGGILGVMLAFPF